MLSCARVLLENFVSGALLLADVTKVRLRVPRSSLSTFLELAGLALVIYSPVVKHVILGKIKERRNKFDGELKEENV